MFIAINPISSTSIHIHVVYCLADQNPEFLAPKIAGRAADWCLGRATNSACRSAVTTARRSEKAYFYIGP
ncbi:unnamed protein product [Leptosia nina]|uniref:Uncharacterized protein n=1 Tax=Leptosia nina TaxID=320188 RepID=A0AAV1J1P5_9NEOP